MGVQDTGLGKCLRRWMLGLLADTEIKELALSQKMIDPFVDRQISAVNGKKVLSYGLGSFGYDVRISSSFKVFTNAFCSTIDPKNFDQKSFIDIETDVCVIPPNSFVLGMTEEYIRVPKDVLVLCIGKSTLARCGIIVNVTPLEPCWEGTVTVEISNTTPLPAKIYAHEGIMQLLFFRGNEPETTYADRKGKYQGQKKITLPRV